MADSTRFKYQARKDFEDGYAQINTGDKAEFEEFKNEHGLGTPKKTRTPVKTQPEAPQQQCNKCGAIANYKTGMTNNKKWAGWFCEDKKNCGNVSWENVK